MTHFELMAMAMESLFGGANYLDHDLRQFILGLLARGELPGQSKER